MSKEETKLRFAELKRILKKHGGKLYPVDHQIVDEYTGLIADLYTAKVGEYSLYAYPCCGTVRKRPNRVVLDNGHTWLPIPLRNFSATESRYKPHAFLEFVNFWAPEGSAEILIPQYAGYCRLGSVKSTDTTTPKGPKSPNDSPAKKPPRFNAPPVRPQRPKRMVFTPNCDVVFEIAAKFNFKKYLTLEKDHSFSVYTLTPIDPKPWIKAYEIWQESLVGIFTYELRNRIVDCLNKKKRGVTSRQAAINRVLRQERQILHGLMKLGDHMGYHDKASENFAKELKNKQEHSDKRAEKIYLKMMEALVRQE